MANKNSTISITFKMDADSKSFKDLVNQSDGLKKALEGNAFQADKLPASIGNMTKAFKVATTAGAMMGAAVAKVMKDMIKDTQTVGDVWNAEMAGMKNSYQQFLSMLASRDLSNFGSRIRTAWGAGRDLERVQDASFEQNNAIRMKEAEIRREQELLREQLNNQQLSNQQRKDAAQKYLDNIRPIYKEQEAIYKSLYDEQVKAFLSTAGLDNNADNRKLLLDYLKNGASAVNVNAQNVGAFRKIDTQYRGRTNEQNGALVNSYVDYYNSLGAFEAENRRITTSFNSLSASIVKGVKEEKDVLGEVTTSIERAVEVARIFSPAQDEMSVRVHATAKELERLIDQYGLADERVKALMGTYRELMNSTTMAALPALGPLTGVATTSGGGLAGTPPVAENAAYTTSLKDMQAAISGVSGALGDMGAAMGDNAAQWLQWTSGILQSIGAAMPAIQAITGAQAASSVASMPFVGPVMAAAAIASVLASFASLPKFAAGGIAYGPTVGMFGEYAGAAHNPEVVAPLDKLRSLIGEGPGMSGHVEFEIDGRKLRGVLRNVDKLDYRNG